MDKIIDIKEEMGEVTLNMKSGNKIKTLAKTIYTLYESGRKDCKLEIQKPIDLFGKQEQIGGK